MHIHNNIPPYKHKNLVSNEKSCYLNVQIPTAENIEYCTFKKKLVPIDT